MFFKKLLVLFALAGCMRSNVFAVATVQHPMSGTVQTVQSHYPVLVEPLGSNLYKIKTGEKIWTIAKSFYGDSSRWIDVVYQNMWLFDRMWISVDKQLHADIESGEILFLDRNYYHPLNAIPAISDNNEPRLSPSEEANVHSHYAKKDSENITFVSLLLMIIFILIAAAYFLWQKKQQSKPEEGAKYVDKGLNNLESALKRIKQVVQSNTGANINSMEVINILSGFEYGLGNCYYPDRPNTPISKRFTGERAIKAEVLLSTGVIEEVTVLESSGNEITGSANFIPNFDQSEDFDEYNQSHGSKSLNSEDQVKHFNWQEETLNIIKSSIDSKMPIFLEVTIAGGSKYKFDSINNRPQKDKAN
ncbi:MAG: hypothetical protein KBB62_00390 [Candidatus Pacebacteria bacterium]|nr:hypothetical protein [Candidatus Paceibacterota bacterium]